MADENFAYIDRHLPLLAAGEYTLTATLDVLGGASREQHAVDLWVGGERFALAPGEVHAVYPPEGSSGPHARTLPHVALRRDTLPWERSADGAGAPWLALLVLSADEDARVGLRTMPLSAFRTAMSPPLEREPGQSETDQVAVIDLDPALVARLPPPSALSSLSHVRGHAGQAGLTDSVAVVVSPHPPTPGRNVVHLVSLEGRYREQAFGTQATTPVVSLYRWSFTCDAADQPDTGSLAVLFQRLDAGWLRIPGAATAAAEPFLVRGRVPLPHRMRSGESGVSWYSGPLVPGAARDAAELVPPLARSADALLWSHEDIGMLDVTYAAAWELGRLLALRSHEVTVALAAWRRRHVLEARRRSPAEADYQHLPALIRADAEGRAATDTLLEGLRSLRRLEGIPFDYLVPDERMLPPESIRFFSVNARWLDALTDGALSLARSGPPTDSATRAVEALRTAVVEQGELSGFILRSAIVSGWPGLEVEASGAAGRLTGLPLRTLSPTVVMGVFEGRATQLVLRQHRGTLHLELPADDDDGSAPDGEGTVSRPSSSVLIPGEPSSVLATRLLSQVHALRLDVRWDG